MGVRILRRDGRVDVYGVPGDRLWTARRSDAAGTLVVAQVRLGQFEEVRRIYRPDEWRRVEIDHGDSLAAR